MPERGQNFKNPGRSYFTKTQLQQFCTERLEQLYFFVKTIQK